MRTVSSALPALALKVREVLDQPGTELTLALTLYPLPEERKWPLAGFGFADDHPANPASRIFKGTANDSPSQSLAHRMGEGGPAKRDRVRE